MCFENLSPYLNIYDFGCVAYIMEYKYLVYIEYNVKYLTFNKIANYLLNAAFEENCVF